MPATLTVLRRLIVTVVNGGVASGGTRAVEWRVRQRERRKAKAVAGAKALAGTARKPARTKPARAKRPAQAKRPPTRATRPVVTPTVMPRAARRPVLALTATDVRGRRIATHSVAKRVSRERWLALPILVIPVLLLLTASALLRQAVQPQVAVAPAPQVATASPPQVAARRPQVAAVPPPGREVVTAPPVRFPSPAAPLDLGRSPSPAEPAAPGELIVTARAPMPGERPLAVPPPPHLAPRRPEEAPLLPPEVWVPGTRAPAPHVQSPQAPQQAAPAAPPGRAPVAAAEPPMPAIAPPGVARPAVVPPAVAVLPRVAPPVLEPPAAAGPETPAVCHGSPERLARDRRPAPPAEAPRLDPRGFGLALALAARAQLGDLVVYNPRYTGIAYPMGDVAPMFGVCTDVVVRAYRALGIDLQELVHKARAGRGDPSIDHRRVDVLRGFLARHGTSLPPSDIAEDYRPGDIVTYYRPQNRTSTQHVAIVTDVVAPSGRLMIVHNRGWGPQLEDALFVDRITGHYRFTGPRPAPEATPAPDLVADATPRQSPLPQSPVPARSGRAVVLQSAAPGRVPLVPVGPVSR